jgi:hypothetical protein
MPPGVLVLRTQPPALALHPWFVDFSLAIRSRIRETFFPPMRSMERHAGVYSHPG